MDPFTDAETRELAGGALLVARRDRVVRITLNRPQARNSFTLEMYEQIAAACTAIAADPSVRVVVFSGSGDKAFAAGTDISEFTGFTSGADGVGYERRVSAALDTVFRMPQVSIAAIHGAAVGGGLALAMCCDLRVATHGSKMGFPIAATLANALSRNVLERLVSLFGESTARQMLLTAELIGAERAHTLGAVGELLDDVDFDEQVDAMADRISRLAPATQVGANALITAIVEGRDLDDGPYMDQSYGHEDFFGAVRSFVARRRGHEFSAELRLPSQ